MSYLTFDEYKSFGYAEMKEEEFTQILPRAEDYLDTQTKNFYRFNDLESDIAFRKKKFKKAIGLQVEYMFTTGAMTTEDINGPQSWSVDGMSVTEASRYSATGKNEAPSILSEDAIAILSGTGLLYRGLR